MAIFFAVVAETESSNFERRVKPILFTPLRTRNQFWTISILQKMKKGANTEAGHET